jgi:hypothetical protein
MYRPATRSIKLAVVVVLVVLGIGAYKLRSGRVKASQPAAPAKAAADMKPAEDGPPMTVEPAPRQREEVAMPASDVVGSSAPRTK